MGQFQFIERQLDAIFIYENVRNKANILSEVLQIPIILIYNAMSCSHRMPCIATKMNDL